MAKNNKRAERMAKSDRNVNRAMILLVVGLVAEFYLLMVNNYFVKGAVGQVLTMMTVLKVLGIVGAAAFGAGLVLWIMRGKWTRFAPAAPWLLCVGFFFAMSSQLMLKIYPQGTTAMCVLVPVAMLLGIVFLLYPREFSLQALALTAAMMAMYLIHRGGGSDTWHGLVVGCSVFAALVIAAPCRCRFQGGQERRQARKARRPSHRVGRRQLQAHLRSARRVCRGHRVALFATGIAYYGLWVLAVGTFLLAVYYTIKMM